MLKHLYQHASKKVATLIDATVGLVQSSLNVEFSTVRNGIFMVKLKESENDVTMRVGTSMVLQKRVGIYFRSRYCLFVVNYIFIQQKRDNKHCLYFIAIEAMLKTVITC